MVIPVIDAKAISGPGGLIDVEENDSQAIVSRFFFPERELRQAFGVSGKSIKMLEVVGDSMTPTLQPGQKVFVDISDCVPSPPGIFVVWDGLGLVLKRIEFIAQSEPARVRISSDNPRYQPYERRLYT